MKYTKRLSLFLALVMVICAMAFSVNAEPTDHTNCECHGAANVAAHQYREVTGAWTELGSADEVITVDKAVLAAGGNFILVGDIKVSGQVNVGANATIHLDLNGHDLSYGGRIFSFWTNSNGTLTVTDSSKDQTGEIRTTGTTLSEGGIVSLSKGGSFRLYSGKLNAEKAQLKTGLTAPGGTAVYVNAANNTMEMYGGSIIGGTTATSGSGVNGGAIAVKAGTVTIHGGTISGGSAANTGGVIYNAGTFTLKGGTIEGGTAKAQGGTIFNGGTFTMEGGSIIGGTATKTGGAIRNDKTFTITGGTIIGGTAANGGAVCNGGGGTFTVNGGSIEGGSAQAVLTEDGSYSADGLGGVLYITSGEIQIHKGTVSGGTAYRGATVYVLSGACSLGAEGKIVGGTATNAGGAVMNKGEFTMSGGIIEGGTAANTAGAVRNDKNFTMTDGQIIGGTANYEGGTIYNTSVFTMENGSIQAADADKCANYGGAVLNHTDATFTISGGTITGGKVKEDGSAIYNRAVLNISGGTINGSIAENGGCVYNADTGTITLSGGTIAGGNVNVEGGAVYNAGTVTMTAGTISGGTAKNGAAITNAGTWTVTNGQITGGTATNNAGAINNSGTLTLDDGSIIGGTAGNNSGAIRNSGSIIMNGGSIAGGSAKNGGIMYTSGSFTMNGGTITGGTATNYGGSIYVASGETSEFILNNGTITGGSANHGGLAYVVGSFTMYGGQVNGGQARNGAAFYVNGSGTLTVSGDEQAQLPALISGTASADQLYGGVIYADAGATVSLQNAYLEANSYANRGTAICANTDCDISLHNVTVGGTYVGATAIWTNSAITLSGNIQMPYEGVDILLDCRNGEITLNAQDMTSTDTLMLRRMGVSGSNEETPGLIGTMNEAQAAVFKAYRPGFVTEYAEGALYLRQAAAGILWESPLGKQETYYLNFADAWSIYEPGMTLVVCSNLDGITIDKDVLIDLNGFAVSNVTVNEGVAVTGLDSSTDDYDCENGYGTIGGTILGKISALANDQKCYAAITDENGNISFHRYTLGITHVSLAPSVVGVGYKATFCADSVLRSHVDSFGYTLQLGEYKAITRQLNGDQLVNAQQVLSLRVKNYDVAGYGETVLKASVFLTIDGQKVESSSAAYSFKDMMKMVDEAYAKLNEVQLAAVKALVAQYAQIMKDWGLVNLTAEA